MSRTDALITVDGRDALRLERRLPHSVERVWRAISEPDEMEAWFVVRPEWTPAAGEPIDAYGGHGEVIEVDPPRTLAWTFGAERYRFELRPDGDGCLLTFTHVFDPELGPGRQHLAGWQAYFARLVALLGGGSLSEAEAHGATLEAGPAVRLERRLPHSVERVWRALTEPEELAHWFPGGEPLEVLVSDPPHVLAGRWFGDPLRLELHAEGDGCRLVLVQAFDDPDTSARTAAGWDRCLARLGALLGGAPMGERESLAGWPEAHERYAARFGVDPELGRRTYAEHMARN
jgi:uncharacterized protein YndB with AHSA1/START domain